MPPPRNHPLVILSVDTVTTRTTHHFYHGVELRAERTVSPTPPYTALVLEQRQSSLSPKAYAPVVIVEVHCPECGLTKRAVPGRLPGWARVLYRAVQNST